MTPDTDTRKWLCTTVFEVEKPFTDSERGCEYYYPTNVIEAKTRGQARAVFFEDLHYGRGYYELEFIDIRVLVYRGDA